MLDSFRNRMRGVAIVIIAFIGIIFTFTGVGSLSLTGAGGKSVASVNGDAISEQDVQRELQQTKARILSENPGLNLDQLGDELFRPSVIERLITNRAVSQRAADLKMSVSPKTLAQILLDVEAFQTDGAFDEDRYRYFIRNRGQTNAEFKRRLAEDIIIEQVMDGYRQSSFVTGSELQWVTELLNQTRDYYYLTLPKAQILADIMPAPEQLQDYYRTHQVRFQSDEQVVLEFIELNRELLMRDKTVTDEAIKTRFDEESDGLASTTSRRAAHILVDSEDSALITEIQKSIAEGVAFSELTKQYSIDFATASQGGDLGFTDGTSFPENFEQALAKLAVGEVSDPVSTDSGVHLIKLIETEESTFTLAGESERIAAELMAESVDTEFVEMLARLRELSYNAESLADLATDLGLPAGLSEPLSRAGGEGIGAAPEVIAAGFSDEVLFDQFASEVLELGDDRYVVIKLKEHILARQKTFEEVSEDVRAAYTEERANQILQQQGTALVEQAQDGESIESIAQAQNLDWQVVLQARRSSSDVDAEINQLAFSMIPETRAVTQSFSTRAGDFVVISLERNDLGDFSAVSEEEQVGLRRTVARSMANREFQAYGNSLLEASSVSR